ncbi:MAG: hypothetical protein HY564_02095 [Candidatus Jacksonbacteria bacterium]|nr:hypothetical protein [Candidatus Jacksonbacteria bacterium]
MRILAFCLTIIKPLWAVIIVEAMPDKTWTCLAIAAFCAHDFIDGQIAAKTSKWRRYLDVVGDKFTILYTMFMFSFSYEFPLYLAGIIGGRELIQWVVIISVWRKTGKIMTNVFLRLGAIAIALTVIGWVLGLQIIVVTMVICMVVFTTIGVKKYIKLT